MTRWECLGTNAERRVGAYPDQAIVFGVPQGLVHATVPHPSLGGWRVQVMMSIEGNGNNKVELSLNGEPIERIPDA